MVTKLWLCCSRALQINVRQLKGSTPSLAQNLLFLNNEVQKIVDKMKRIINIKRKINVKRKIVGINTKIK